jgi:hypothetical protein
MTGNKPNWIKSNLPFKVKIKLWRVIRDNNTYNNSVRYLTNNSRILTDDEWESLEVTKEGREKGAATISRDTFDNLKSEIAVMPLKELAALPEDIINWERGRRGHKHLEISIDSLIAMHIDHRDKMAIASRRLADNLQPYRLLTNGTLKEWAFGEEWESDLVQQLASDAPTKWLLPHLQAEAQGLKDVDTWEDIPYKDIMDYLEQLLYNKAETKQFLGKCNICKDWDPIDG